MDEDIIFTIDNYYFYKEVIKHEKGKNITKCIQCGTCSGTCPVERIKPEYSPRKIIAQILAGFQDEVIHSPLMWICARCQYCVVKCPKGVKPGEIITVIRNIAIKNGILNNAGVRHTLAFKDDILTWGRLNEATLPIKTLGFIKTSQMAPFAAKMFFKGKLPNPIPKHVKGLNEIRKINTALEEQKK